MHGLVTQRRKVNALYEVIRRSREAQMASRDSLIEFVMEHLDAYEAAIAAKRVHQTFHVTPPAVAEAEQLELRRQCASRLLSGIEVLLKPRTE